MLTTPRISVIEAKNQFENGKLIILDIREDHEVDEVHIEGSLHIKMKDIPQNLSKIPKNQDVGVLCLNGERSVRVTEYLLDQGFQKIKNITGGIYRWGLEADSLLFENN